MFATTEESICPRPFRRALLPRITVLGLLVLALAVSGCNRGGVTTESTVTVTYANSSQVIDDPTALTTFNYTRGCVASGGQQPPDPSLYGWQQFGTSPTAGKCTFSGVSSNGSAPGEFQSLACLSVGLPWDVVTTITWTNGVAAPVNVCTAPSFQLPLADGHFATTDRLPSTVTIYAGGISSAYGNPQLVVYDRNGAVVGSSTASAVASDGSNATFPFPNGTSGSVLTSAFYLFAIKNWISTSGDFKIITATYYDLGTTTSAPGAFGIDAYDSQYSLVCTPSNFYCNRYWLSVGLVFTDYYGNQLVGSNGGPTPVGIEPVAVKTYGSATITDWSGGGATQTHTMPARAIVINFGSNNVSIVNLVSHSIVATIPVGVQPAAVVLDSTASHAYVANYGSGTLSDINLSTLTVSRTVSVGTSPQAVSMDPSGSAVWVGGPGYLKKVNLSTFAVATTSSITGTVTSLATSQQQNELVYTSVSSGCCGTGSTYATHDVLISNLSSQGTYGSGSATTYAAYTMGGTLPSGSFNPGATQVSTRWANGMAASATPTGFVVYDVVSHREIMQGTTPTPVRGIATNPNNTVMYVSLPDSNMYISVPLPQ